MLFKVRTWITALLTVAVVHWGAAPAYGDTGSFLYSRKFYGVLSLASSAVFFREAYEAKRDANRNYRLYKSADTAALATASFNEAKRGDTRMALMLGLGAGTLAFGTYMFLNRGGDHPGQGGKPAKKISIKGIGVDVQGDAVARSVKLQLNRSF